MLVRKLRHIAIDTSILECPNLPSKKYIIAQATISAHSLITSLFIVDQHYKRTIDIESGRFFLQVY